MRKPQHIIFIEIEFMAKPFRPYGGRRPQPGYCALTRQLQDEASRSETFQSREDSRPDDPPGWRGTSWVLTGPNT